MTAKCVVDASSRPTPKTLLQLFQKKQFQANFGLNFFRFLNDCKVLMRRPQDLRPGQYVVQNC